MTAFEQAFALIKNATLEPPEMSSPPPPMKIPDKDGWDDDDSLPADECCIQISTKWYYETSAWGHEEWDMPHAMGDDDPDYPETYDTLQYHTQNACDNLREKLEEWASGRFGEKHSVNYDKEGHTQGLLGPQAAKTGLNEKLQAFARQLLTEWDDCASKANRRHPSSYFTASADPQTTAVEQAWALIKGIISKLRQCRDCGRIAYRNSGVCGVSLKEPVDGIKNNCSGSMQVIRYPTDEQIKEADEWRAGGYE
jgi:hypothetical protein